MQPVLFCAILVLLCVAGWFYEARYVPLTANLAEMTAKNQSMQLALDKNKEEIKSLTDAKKADEAKISADETKITDLNKALAEFRKPPSDVTITDDDIIAVDPPASIGDITDNGGKTYFNCMLVKIEPDGLNVLHKAGAAKLFFTDLSPDLQKKYHYNPTKDAIYRDMEAKHMADSDEARADYEAQQKALNAAPHGAPRP
jgi:hypothetical protein